MLYSCRNYHCRYSCILLRNPCQRYFRLGTSAPNGNGQILTLRKYNQLSSMPKLLRLNLKRRMEKQIVICSIILLVFVAFKISNCTLCDIFTLGLAAGQKFHLNRLNIAGNNTIISDIYLNVDINLLCKFSSGLG